MKRLSYRDLQTLVAALGVLNSDISLQNLSERSTRTITEIIKSEIISFDAFNSNDRYDFTAWTTCDEIYRSDLAEKFQAFVHQHPLIPVVVGNKIQSAIKMTDYISQSDFENLELYNEYFRVIRVRRQMGLALPIADNFTIACSVNRSGKDFSERDRLMLTLLAPHLLTAIRSAYFIDHLEKSETRLSGLLDLIKNGLVVLSSEGQVEFISDAARLMLRKYFASERFVSNALPEALQRWIAAQTNNSENGTDLGLPTPPLLLKNADGKLQIQLTRNSRTKECTLMLTEKVNFSAASLAALGLTNRETEILFLIMQGKTNSEIALLCGIKTGTVKKHIENIYSKLGVETRTAATLKALETVKL